MDVSQWKVEDLQISQRLKNLLLRAEINTVEQMLTWSDEDLMQLRNMGAKSLQELQAFRAKVLAEHADASLDVAAVLDALPPPEMKIQDFSAWAKTDAGQAFICKRLQEKGLGIADITLMPPRTYNLLRLAGWSDLGQLLYATEEELLQLPRMDAAAAQQAVRLCQDYLASCEAWLTADWEQEQLAEWWRKNEQQKRQTEQELSPETAEKLKMFARANDWTVEELNISTQARNKIRRAGFTHLSQFIGLDQQEWEQIHTLSVRTKNLLQQEVARYMAENQQRVELFLQGDMDSLWDDAAIQNKILALYQENPHGGFSLQEMRQQLPQFESVSEGRFKHLIGGLLAAGKLEYVDYRCYRVYPSIRQLIEQCPDLEQHKKDVLWGRLAGITLEELGKQIDVTRERVRQISTREIQKVIAYNRRINGSEWTEEDYYRYFYEAYDIEKQDAVQWLGISETAIHYLELIGAKQGTKDLTAALEDHQHLDFGLRLKIKQYLHRNQILVDGIWVDKKRVALEEVVVRKYCQTNTSYEDFGNIYNAFLKEHGILEGDKLYYTPEVAYSRRNHLEQSNMLLWKFGGVFRAYDVNGRDYTELWETLQLDSYENVEYSAQKFVNDYPELMRRYDIQDGYELHNLMRKAFPTESVPGFRFGKQPVLCFGNGNRMEAIFDLMVENAPINYLDLAQLVYQEYGFAPETTAWILPKSFPTYFHKGMFTVDQKKMLDMELQQFSDALPEPFYYFGQVKKIYREIFPQGDLEMLNPYNLKRMGFLIFSNYVIRGYPSAEAYFTELLTKDDVFDCKPYRKKFNLAITTFSAILTRMRHELKLIEFGPDQYINFRRLEAAGVTKEQLQQFCDAVYDSVETGAYFSIPSIRADGFTSELFELGMEDWFYANLLFADERFSYGMMFGCPILYKGNQNISIKSFLYDQLQAAGSYDVLEWVHLLTERYGCRSNIERTDILYKLDGTGFYYDEMLDRVYANAELYYQELDRMEDV